MHGVAQAAHQQGAGESPAAPWVVGKVQCTDRCDGPNIWLSNIMHPAHVLPVAAGMSKKKAYLEESSLGRRKASSAGPRLMSAAWGTWRLIRLLTEASPSDSSDKERDEATCARLASLECLGTKR